MVAKELASDFKEMLVVLKRVKEVFVWSYKDMKDLNLEFYQHNINLTKNIVPMHQCKIDSTPTMQPR